MELVSLVQKTGYRGMGTQLASVLGKRMPNRSIRETIRFGTLFRLVGVRNCPVKHMEPRQRRFSAGRQQACKNKQSNPSVTYPAAQICKNHLRHPLLRLRLRARIKTPQVPNSHNLSHSSSPAKRTYNITARWIHLSRSYSAPFITFPCFS